MPNGNNNNNNNATVLATPNSNNNSNNNNNANANKNNKPIAATSPKSQSSAEGTRRVNPGTGKIKTKAQIQAAVMMKRAKKVLNDALGIKSTPPEFNPLIKIIKRENFANEPSKKAAINAYIAEIKTKRNAKASTKATTTATKKASKKTNATNAPNTKNKNKNTTVTNKPKRQRKAKVTENPVPEPVPVPVPEPVVASPGVLSTEKKAKRKVEVPSAAQSQYKTNMAAAKKLLNNTLSIKSMPPEHNPLVGIMRKNYASEAEKKAAIDAHVEKIRAARAEKASKKATKGGARNYRTRKQRRL